MTTSNPPQKYPLTRLPLAPRHLLTSSNLTPDPLYPSHKVFRSALGTAPSPLRRSRIVPGRADVSYGPPPSGPPTAHFSYCTPLPIEFPYGIKVQEGENGAEAIEKWLAAREPLEEERKPEGEGGLGKYGSGLRDWDARLVAVSETALRDCLPHLEVGEEGNEERRDFVDVLSGKSVLLGEEYAPYSLRYGGHQFGFWASQLGDGRAITIFETVNPETGEKQELQLKGAGRTAYSRYADGLAVLRSSVREFLGSEAMAALRVPTTRALSLIHLPRTNVRRERLETAALVCRLSPSWLRLGNFQILNPPRNVGMPREPEWDGLLQLVRYTGGKVFGWEKDGKGKEEEGWAEKVVREVAQRNARMVARWQAYGFMHGVLNSDNHSVLGVTIDYGPFAFMDVYDAGHICNHSDDEGIYSYRLQPSRVLWAVHRLIDSLAELIGAERASGRAALPGWGEKAAQEEGLLERWREDAEKVREDVEAEFKSVFESEFREVFGKRLGLKRLDRLDQHELFDPLLNMLEEHELDFHSTLRTLSRFTPSTPASSLLPSLLPAGRVPQYLAEEAVPQAWTAWLEKYAQRIQSERAEWGEEDGEGWEERRKSDMRGWNPRFVLRQWVLEEVIGQLEKGEENGFRRVLEMVHSPFEPWGAEDKPESEPLDEEERERRRLCGMGDDALLGFQCSCSS